MKLRNKILLLLTIFYTALTFIGSSVPFFWDGTFFSFAATDFFRNGFHGFIAPLNGDSGGFPLFPSYLALSWKIFGKSIFVSHLVMLPFLLGVANEYLKLGERYLSDKMLLFFALLLMCEPVFLTQSLLIGYDIIMVFFFLLSLNYLLGKKENEFALSLVLLCSCSIRGIILGASLLMLDLFIHGSFIRSLKKYLPALVIVPAWAVYHYYTTGWYLISPLRENTHESLLPVKMIFRQVLFIAWKLNDFGRVFLWIFVIISAGIYRREKNEAYRQLFLLLFVPLTVAVIAMSPLGNPVGHKYFIVHFLILNIAVCYFLQMMSRNITNVFCVLFTIVLISGNFWIYPQKFGNGWDSSLKIMPYFRLKEEMDNYITENNIDPENIGTQFPLITDKRFSHLDEISFSYTNVWSGPVSNYKYILESNVINTDIPEQMEDVRKDWIIVKTLKKGLVHITLYKNPAF